MQLVAVYPAAGGLGVLIPADPDRVIEDIAASVIPQGTPHRIVAAESLPPDVAYRDAWTANFDDEACVVSVDPIKKAAIDKKLALDAANVFFDSAVAEGYATDEGWTLGMTVEDVTLLTGNYVLAREADAAGLPLPPVIDRNGVPHQMESLEDMTALMLAYGQYRATLSAEYAARKAAIEG